MYTYTIHQMKVIKIPRKQAKLGYDLYLPLVQVTKGDIVTLPNGKQVPYYTWEPFFNVFPKVFYSKATLDKQISGKKKNTNDAHLLMACDPKGNPLTMEALMKMLERAFPWPLIIEKMIDGIDVKDADGYHHITESGTLIDLMLVNNQRMMALDEVEFDLREANYTKHQIDTFSDGFYIIETIFNEMLLYYNSRKVLTKNLTGEDPNDTAKHFESEDEAIQHAIEAENLIVKNNGFAVKKIPGIGIGKALDYMDMAQN